jgi:hypothetical protein
MAGKAQPPDTQEKQRGTRQSLHHTATELCNQRLFQHSRLVSIVIMLRWLATGPEFHDRTNPVLAEGYEVLP